MSENWKIQVSPKLPDGTLVNIRAESAEELTSLLNYAQQNAQLITDTAALLIGARNAAPVTQSQAQQAPAQQPQQGGWGNHQQQSAPPLQFPQQPAQGGVAQTKQGSLTQAPGPSPASCEHGAYVWNDFVSKAQNNVKGFFCPATFRTECKPEFRK